MNDRDIHRDRIGERRGSSPGDRRKRYGVGVSGELKTLDLSFLNTGFYDKQNAMYPQLDKIYVKPKFNRLSRYRKQVALEYILDHENNIVVTGEPGAGKSTLVKYVALLYLEKFINGNKKGKLPFVFPLSKSLQAEDESRKPIDFVEYILKTFEKHCGIPCKRGDFFSNICPENRIIVFFDGLDEIEDKHLRTTVAKSIEQFAVAHNGIRVWVTCRSALYCPDVKLSDSLFTHYQLAPLDRKEARGFIEKWYEEHITGDESLRKDLTRKLQDTLDENRGMGVLAKNPLLLTLMTMLHQFGETLPCERANYYEKCLELMLKTWNNKNEHSQLFTFPQNIEQSDLSYDDQVKLFAEAAFELKKSSPEPMREDARRRLDEKEWEKIMIDIRCDPRRRTREKAEHEIRALFDHIHRKASFFVQEKRKKKGEFRFSLSHIPIFDYLCAYRMYNDKFTPQEHYIDELTGKLEDPDWEEPTLLYLRLCEKSTSPISHSFIYKFCDSAFKKYGNKRSPAWLVMGRAVRDNIDFSPDEIETIIRNILNIWFKEKEEILARKVILDIGRFSATGRDMIKMRLQPLAESVSPETPGIVRVRLLFEEIFSP